MKITDLIKRLEELRAEHGDVPVYKYDNEWDDADLVRLAKYCHADQGETQERTLGGEPPGVVIY